MKYWKKFSHDERLKHIKKALQGNVNFSEDPSLGYPASRLDEKVFNDEATFLKDSPILQSFVANPNHIGCHTFGSSEKAFKGTQDVEHEVLNIVAVDIFKAQPDSFDGYIAPGGTEANIQAIWVYRNYFINNYNALPEEIVILASEDTHYSIPKGSNLLMVDYVKVPVNFEDRSIHKEGLKTIVEKAVTNGKKYFIIVANMGTTMFGSVDDVSIYTDIIQQHKLTYKLHIDAAYGGFIYPFSNKDNEISFLNPNISSITIDAHKMLQAPYGTGIFICRKGFIENVLTKEAEYVEGMDLTLCGSRSGANAVAVWTILSAYGPHAWFEKISILQMRTAWLCNQLDELGISYYRNPHMNIVTIKAEGIPDEIAHKFDLVPQKHDESNQWYKIIVMGHVEIEDLSQFTDTLKTLQNTVIN
ncbi:pyridoxal-dependent decarboxylase [Flavobacterium alkalisoli]|uniref:pyridoxal-dependent decarboxylase n=1 Tax=Flavobacterium alkalisoli TaxID=2602769 RepID=UPI003A948231